MWRWWWWLEGKKDDECPRFKNEVRKMLSRFKFLRNGTNWRPNSVSHAIKYANPVLLGVLPASSFCRWQGSEMAVIPRMFQNIRLPNSEQRSRVRQPFAAFLSPILLALRQACAIEILLSLYTYLQVRTFFLPATDSLLCNGSKLVEIGTQQFALEERQVSDIQGSGATETYPFDKVRPVEFLICRAKAA